ncbi:MAG: nicotinate (nicotinamide) nucleotide adenylyltransferase [Campylobacterota bacterium]|nr:nicotinate (nicotinamide) nucleotide adenylyltransferase [Campylobacterota bacterium]
METIALFGGSFDPPHIGHKAIVEALDKLNYIDKVIVMPTFLNPFKSSSHASSELRIEWLRKIFHPFHNIIVDNYEVKQNRAVTSLETVSYLRERYSKIYLVIGADNLRSLEKWNNFEQLNSLVTFIVASRDNIEIEERFIYLKIDENISSSQLREQMDSSKLPKECAVEIEKYYKDINEQ